ncbi:MAG: helicase C-terminal domain-containing protein [Kiritimatiellia bacterium]
MNVARLPTWALDVMHLCAQNAEAVTFAKELDAARNDRLFTETKDEAWYANYQQFARTQPRSLPSAEQWIPVEQKTLDAIFGEGGELSKQFPHYEPRAGQTAMAHAVAEALNGKDFLLAEAGTGVGKSLAYLVPCALWACANNLPIVISTNTRNLQTQLITKDIPLVRKIIASYLPPNVRFSATVLKGRNNYLCLKRFGALVEGGFASLAPNELLLFADFVAWASETSDGDLDAFRPEHARGDQLFIHTLGCRAEECTGKNCRFSRRCFLLKARQSALQAHLIIANHALVFAELSSPGTILPPHAQIVFDEAHNLESAATKFLSGTLSPVTLYDFCQKIAPSKGREVHSLSYQIRTEFIDKAIQDPAERVELIALLADIRTCGVTLAKVGTDLFETLHMFLEKTPETTLRYRSVPDQGQHPQENGQRPLHREVCLTGTAFVSSETFVPETDIHTRMDAIDAQFHTAKQLLDRLLLAIARKAPPEEVSPYNDLTAAVKALTDNLDDFATNLKNILAGADPGMVYWMERINPRDHQVILTAAPLDIAHQLKKLVYDNLSSVIFSSATLRIRNDFTHIRHRLGLELLEKEHTHEFVAESPFDYPHQCCVAVPGFLPEIEDATYVLELSRMMYQLFVTAKGRSLALFTSYEMMRACAEKLEPFLKEKGIELLVQSAILSRDAITETFRANDRPCVLFGTQSFWEGVDVVGDALSCVVIARLPFESYGDPLFKARCEQIEQRGGSAFAELSVPQAVIRFRQGFGRLIRSRRDHGIIVVADSRIVKKNYGSSFAKSLPCAIEVIKTRALLTTRLNALLRSPMD